MKIHSPFQRLIQINIEMDKMARDKMKLCNNEDITQHKRPVYLHTVLGCYTSEGMFIGNICRYLYDNINGKKLCRNLTNVFGWNDENQATINWRALEDILTSLQHYSGRKLWIF